MIRKSGKQSGKKKPTKSAAKPPKSTGGGKHEKVRMSVSFFVRPTRLTGQLPPVSAEQPEALRSEDDVGIPVPDAVLQLTAHGKQEFTLPLDQTSAARAKHLEREMRKLFKHTIAVDNELTLGDGTISYNPKGGPPWLPKPDGNAAPAYIAEVRIGDVAEHPVESAAHPTSNYEMAYRWYVVGRLT